MNLTSPVRGLFIVVALLSVWPPSLARGADPTFVGVLALAVDDEGARKLGLSDETRENLMELIDRRERAALGIALEIKDLPPAEIAARLAPFVAESERQGMALLTVEQRAILQQMRIARQGMDSLQDPEVAQVLELTAEQQSAAGALFEQRARDLTRGGENERRITRDLYQRKLAEVLTKEQRANWERLAGLAPPDAKLVAQDPALPDATAAEPETPEPAPREPAPQPAEVSQSVTDDEASADEPAEATAAIDDEVELRFNFHHQPWRDVLEWFAEQADLSLQLDVYPTGTFNYRDSRAYTPAEALDLMNGMLLIKGYTLVRRERLLTLINLDDEVPPQLVELVPLADLDERGDFELIKCLFQLVKLDPAEAEAEISRLVGPQGSVIALPKAGQLLVTETAGKLRTIRSVIEAVENPRAGMQQGILEITLDHVGPEDVLAVARPLLALDEEQNANEDIRIAVDPFTSRIFATGTRDAIQKLNDIVPLVDRAPDQRDRPLAPLEQPQLSSYQILKADPSQVLAVAQTLLAGLPDVRLSVDPVTNKLIVLARPSEHRTVLETLRMLEGDAEQTEVIQLRRMDPQSAILAINKLFGLGGEDATAGPRVDGDPTTMKLWVRGTSTEIAQIRELVEKLEGPEATLSGLRERIRLLPYSGSAVRSALDNVELFWPAVRENRIRLVPPSAAAPSVRQRTPALEYEESQAPLRQREPAAEPIDSEDFRSSDGRPPAARRAVRSHAPRTFLAVLHDETGGEPEEAAADEAEGSAAAEGEQEDGSDAPAAAGAAEQGTQGQEHQPPAEIVVRLTPSGLIIASDDLDALDDFERLLRSFIEQGGISGQEPTVFWLKYARADVVAEILNQVLSGTTSTSDSGLLGDVASSVLGDGLLGSLLSSGSSVPTGSAIITPDVRLNALIVQASLSDLSLIDRLLPVLDREAGPEDVQTAGKPKLIPVTYMAAEDMANILRQVYAERLAGAGNQQQRGPSPADFIRALRGGGGRGGRDEAEQEPPKMTIGVDSRSNSLIVTAPDPLLTEVETLVAQLDRAGFEADETMTVVTVRSNPELIQKALTSIAGNQVQSSTSSSGSSSSASSAGSSGTPGGGQFDPEAIRQRIEFFRQLRGGGDDGPGGGFGRGGFPGGGFPGGGFPGGGFGRGGGGFGGGGGGAGPVRGGGGPTRGGGGRGGR